MLPLHRLSHQIRRRAITCHNFPMAIPENFIQDVLYRTDTVEVVGQYVQLKRAGANYSGLCPFHSEKTPSFTVSPTKQFYHCFGCGKNGNAISFLMEHLGMGFTEAVRTLAQQAGLPMPQDDSTPQQRIQRARRKDRNTRLTDTMQTAVNYYCTQLKNHPEAQQYLKNRDINPDIAGQYRLGYAPQSWQNLAAAFLNYDDALLEQAGLVIHKAATETTSGKDRRYDRFRERIIFPIRNIRGECIALGGRILGKGEPKYLNSPETPIFHKGQELYGLYEARTSIQKAGYCLVTEGYMDVIALAQNGFAHAVASLGTACTADHIRKLLRFTDSIVFAFDGDRAGRAAADKAMRAALSLAADGRSIKFVFLPASHDPDSYVRELGQDAFKRLIADATPLSQLLITHARTGCNLEQAEGRARFLQAAQPLWQPLPDGALKQQLFAEIAALGKLNEQALTDIWAAQNQRRQRFSQPHHTSGKPDRKPLQPHPPHQPLSPQRRHTPAGHAAAADPAASPKLQRAAQILLSRLELWASLSIHQQDILCHSPEPYRQLFSWLDATHTRCGALSWRALQNELTQTPLAALANRLIRQLHTDIKPSSEELARILFQLTLEQKEQQASQLARTAGSNPADYAAFQQLSREIADMKKTRHTRVSQ